MSVPDAGAVEGGNDEEWRVLDKTRDQIENPLKFDENVDGEVERFTEKVRY